MVNRTPELIKNKIHLYKWTEARLQLIATILILFLTVSKQKPFEDFQILLLQETKPIKKHIPLLFHTLLRRKHTQTLLLIKFSRINIWEENIHIQ